MCEEAGLWVTSVVQVRTILLKFAKLLGSFQEHLSCEQVAEVSARAKSSITGIKGGFLFEYYVVLFGKKKLQELLLKRLGEASKAPLTSSSLDQLLPVWTSCKLQWIGWLLKGIKDLSNKNSQQLFWLTAVLDNKGLSHSGQALGSRLNFCLHPKTFQRLMAEQIEVAHANNVREVLATPHVWWVDNYNKSYGQRFYKLGTGPQVVLNWTGWGAALAPGFARRKLKRPKANKTKRAMLPEQLYTQDNKKLLQQIIQATSEDGQSVTSIFFTSFCRTHNIFNTPLKPTVTGPVVDNNDLKWMAEHNDGLCNFVPLGLLKENIAADSGLAKVVLQLVSFYNSTGGKYFSIGKVDISIYWRLNLLFYSRLNPLKELKELSFVHLGWWHPYKYGCELLWKKYLPTLMGQAFHSLFPTSRCMRKPKLVTLVSFFNQLSLAYEGVRSELLDLYESSRCKKVNDLSSAIQDQLHNLVCLFERFLPRVRDYGAILKLGKFKSAFQALQQLWLVFVALHHEGLYCRGVLLYMIQLNYWRTCWKEPFSMLKDSFSAFVEEDGELSFSVLSRTVLQDSHKSSFNTLNNAYRSQRLLLQATSSFAKEYTCTDFSRNTHSVTHSKDIEVVRLQRFLHLHIQQLQKGLFDPYPPLGQAAFYPPQKDLLLEMARTACTAVCGEDSTGYCGAQTIRFPPRDAPFQTTELEDRSMSVLASLHRLLVEENASGLEVSYILHPQQLVVEALVMEVDSDETVSTGVAESQESSAMTLDEWL